MENTEKYKTFYVPIEKEVTNIDKDGNKSVVTISYKINFTDSARFMATSLSNLVDNFTEVFQRIKCEDCDCFLEYESAKDNLIKYVYLAIKIIETKLMKRLKNTFKFPNNDINKFILLIRKGVYT